MLVAQPAKQWKKSFGRNVDATARLIAAAAYDVLALAVATTLAVFKPGKPKQGNQR